MSGSAVHTPLFHYTKKVVEAVSLPAQDVYQAWMRCFDESGTNMMCPPLGSFVPVYSTYGLNFMNGRSIDGRWGLSIGGTGNIGMLNSWCLNVTLGVKRL